MKGRRNTGGTKPRTRSTERRPIKKSVSPGTVDGATGSQQSVDPQGGRPADQRGNAIRDPLVWATVAIALATVVMVGIAYLQVRALWSAENTTRATERPFVTAAELDISYDGIGYWFFRVRAQNSGSTPTRNLQYVVTTSRAPTDPEDIFRVTPDYISKFRGIIGPRTTLPVFGGSGLPAKTIEEMANRRQNYFVFGVFHYQDWFSGQSNYLTKFCFAAIPYLKGDKVHVSYEPCLFWNCADDECEIDKREYEKELKKLN